MYRSSEVRARDRRNKLNYRAGAHKGQGFYRESETVWPMREFDEVFRQIRLRELEWSRARVYQRALVEMWLSG